MNGKEKCKLFKAMRREIAEANGIVYLSAECNYEGDCPGYCPKCDAESRYLDSELNRLAAEGKTLKITGISYQNFVQEYEKTAASEETATTTESDPDGMFLLGEEETGAERMSDIIAEMTVEELDLSLTAYRPLKKAGFNTVGDLSALSKTELFGIRNLSKKSAEEIIEKLSRLHIELEDYEQFATMGVLLPTEDGFFDDDPL